MRKQITQGQWDETLFIAVELREPNDEKEGKAREKETKKHEQGQGH